MHITKAGFYGDLDNYNDDKKVLMEILSRQGSRIAFDAVGDQVATASMTFGMRKSERDTLNASLLADLGKVLDCTPFRTV